MANLSRFSTFHLCHYKFLVDNIPEINVFDVFYSEYLAYDSEAPVYEAPFYSSFLLTHFFYFISHTAQR